MRSYKITWVDKKANKFHPITRTNFVKAANEKDARSALIKTYGCAADIVSVDEFVPED